jgi:uncharacterized membrane protein (GlpM family)
VGNSAAVLLALKLILVPALLAVISMAGKRWGPGVAGWLAGFPSLTGPILFFLALERGPEFTTQASVLALACVFPAIAFGVSYAWACRRLRWQGSLVCAFSAWTLAVLLLAQLPLTVGWSLAISLLTLFAAPRLFPRPQAQWGSRPMPPSELLLRMAAGALMVLGVTAAAEALGSVWTGLFAAFPVMSSVLAVFSHRANGPGFVVAMLRSMIGGFYSYITYCLSVALMLEHFGIAVTYTVAVAAAVAVQGVAKGIMMRAAR